MFKLCKQTDEDISPKQTVLYTAQAKVACNLTAVSSDKWQPNVARCGTCNRQFSMFSRRHHCRSCGRCVCGRCTTGRVVFCGGQFSGGDPQRVCDNCVDAEVTSPPTGQRRHRKLDSDTYGAAAEGPESCWEELEGAIAEGNVAELEKLCSTKLSDGEINSPGGDGYTALTWATCKNKQEAIEVLIRHGADVNALDETQQHRTALIIASCKARHIQVLVQLLEAKAEVDKPTLVGRTALMTACAAGLAEVVRTLVAYGANPTIRNNTFEASWAPVDYARKYNHTNVVAIMTKHEGVPLRTKPKSFKDRAPEDVAKITHNICATAARESMTGALVEESFMPQLLDVVRDTGRPWRVRQDASLALIRLVESGDMREWLITQEACAVPILLRTIQDCDTDSRMCRGVIKALDNFIVSDDVRKSLVQARALKPLKALLSSADPELQKLAAMVVANIALCKELQTARDSLQPNMVRDSIIAEGIVHDELKQLVEHSSDKFCKYWASKAICVISDAGGRAAVVDAGFVPLFVELLKDEESLAKRGAAEALHSLSIDTQATQQMMESGLLPCLQPMLEWESDIYGRDTALTLLDRICVTHQEQIGALVQSGVISWVVPLLETADNHLDEDDEIECDKCGELILDGRRFRAQSEGDKDLCAKCAYEIDDKVKETDLVLELPRDKACRLLMSMMPHDMPRHIFVQEGALPLLAAMMTDGTHHGIQTALSAIKTFVLDSVFTAEVYGQVGYGPIALAIGVPMAQISVKEQLKILGLPVDFIEPNQTAAEAADRGC